MEPETSSSRRMNPLDLSHSSKAGSIHGVVPNHCHSLSKSMIDMEAIMPIVTITRTTNEIKGTACSDGIVPSSPLLPSQRIAARIQFMTLWLSLFLIGWNDGSSGPLLPRIQEAYHVGYVNVSLIFITAWVGFIVGAVANMYLTDKIGFGKIIALGSLFQVIAYAIQSSAPPLPVFMIAYAINGVGMIFQDAQINGFVTILKDNAAAKMGILHAGYGLGALISPLIATQFAQLPRWSFHFLVSLGIALTNNVLLIVVFRLKRQDECFLAAGEVLPEKDSTNDNERSGSFKKIFTTPAVHLLAFFLLFYVGVTVTIGGWIVTFIIQVRDGGPSSGYISAGFFGGLTIGRVALLWINKKVGERRVLFIYTLLTIGLDITIWFTPSLIANAVAIAFIGIFHGPLFPIVMSHSSRVLPREILTGSVGWISGFGQAGSALLPFITGAVASSRGIQSLQPLLVGMMGCMIILWALVPNGPQRAGQL